MYFLYSSLEEFRYRTTLDVITTYFVSFGIVALIVSLTIGYQVVKASVANPVNSLRSE